MLLFPEATTTEPDASKTDPMDSSRSNKRGNKSSSSLSLSSNGAGAFAQNPNTVEVYDHDFVHVLLIAKENILHCPHPRLGVSRLVLCRNFRLDSPESCSKGQACKFVHADPSGAKRHAIHVNYAWRSLEACTYTRREPGKVLTVFAPNERPPTEQIPSERVLVTKGSKVALEELQRAQEGRPAEEPVRLSHCAHYYFNRMCNRGEKCHFIHAVHVDPNAFEFQRAPAPSTVAPLSEGKRKAHVAAAAAAHAVGTQGTPNTPTVNGPINAVSGAPNTSSPSVLANPANTPSFIHYPQQQVASAYPPTPQAAAAHGAPCVPPPQLFYAPFFVNGQQVLVPVTAPPSASAPLSPYIVLQPPPPPAPVLYYANGQPLLYQQPVAACHGGALLQDPAATRVPTTDPQGRPSMTSLFSAVPPNGVWPTNAEPDAAVLQPPRAEQSGGCAASRRNPLEWSFFSGVSNYSNVMSATAATDDE